MPTQPKSQMFGMAGRAAGQFAVGPIIGGDLTWNHFWVGTTKIGKYLLNHSFMLPGLVTIFSAIVIALLLGAFLPA